MSNITCKDPRDEVVSLMERIRNPFNRGNLTIEDISSMSTALAVIFIGDGIAELNKNFEKLFSTISENSQQNSELEQRIRELEEAQRWRKYPDEKPVEQKEYLCIIDCGCIEQWGWEGENGWEHTHGEFITHWRPLPPPPQDKE